VTGTLQTGYTTVTITDQHAEIDDNDAAALAVAEAHLGIEVQQPSKARPKRRKED
jgi:hypothetical protein